MLQLGVLNPDQQFPVNSYPDKVLHGQQQGPKKQQQIPTNFQQGLTNSQTSQFIVKPLPEAVKPLSEQALQAKRELEILVATGKTKDLIGKQLTFQDLDNLDEKSLLKYYSIYQQNMAARCNDTFSKLLIGGYSKLCKCFLPIEDEDKLYTDLRNDYVLMNEVDRWVGWFSIKAGSFMALGTASLITFNNTNFHNINNGSDRNSDGIRGEIKTDKKEK